MSESSSATERHGVDGGSKSIAGPEWAIRSQEQVREHYRIEKELAQKLRDASKQERRSLYTALYMELFRLVPHHPMLTAEYVEERRERAIDIQLRLLRRFVNSNAAFLEIGAGDCALTYRVAHLVKEAVAVDVADTSARASPPPPNFKLVISDGCEIPLRDDSIDIAYSDQLMEHLHPEDALQQLNDVHRVIKPGGYYLCTTPNRLSGPHDISRGFDPVATGFHLREYTVGELRTLFMDAGFRRVFCYLRIKGHFIPCSVRVPIVCERLLMYLPLPLRRKIADSTPFRQLINVCVVGAK